MLVSIIIPARNEAEDIGQTLEACLAIDYEFKEIIVVDDSTDDTPAIVASYADRGVRLIHRDENTNGCCGARNLGMLEAKGEIVVLLNADDMPRPDFLKRLLPHYRDGADYVIVKSTALNTGNPWGKLIMVSETAGGYADPEWSEGFSCRRSAAESVGYIPGDFPVPFCRDYMFGVALNRGGFKKHVDMSIPMEHIVPDRVSSFWRNQMWRGTFSAPHVYYFRNMPVAMILPREMLKALRTLLKYMLIVPAIWQAVRLSRYAPNGLRDAASLLLAGLVRDFAMRVGNFKGVLRVILARG
jgi:glycosyltransferase involved in cell wall biosynthesis